MARFDETNEQAKQQWLARIEQKRVDISASVEETLQDNDSLVEDDQWLDEADTIVSDPPVFVKGPALIRPRLSLQSKPIPTVRPVLPPLALASEPVSMSNGTVQMPPPPATPFSQTGSGETSSYNRQPMLRRTTKVHLQAVTVSEATRKPSESGIPVHDLSTQPGIPAVKIDEESPTLLLQKFHEELTGSGRFAHGQSDLVVNNTLVTISSVVVIMLTGDPGPVVVQYVTLQPGIGFTIHLSASAQRITPFNYRILD